MTVEHEMIISVIRKILMGEDLSMGDFQRFMSLHRDYPLKISIPDQGQILGAQGQFKALLQERYLK